MSGRSKQTDERDARSLAACVVRACDVYGTCMRDREDTSVYGPVPQYKNAFGVLWRLHPRRLELRAEVALDPAGVVHGGRT